MSPAEPAAEDPRQVARRALQTLHDRSLCGHCRDDYATMADALEKDGEFEELMRRYVEVDRRHPMAAALPERARQIREARDEAQRRLGVAPAAAPAPVLRYRAGDAQGVVRSWREGLREVVPRPFEFLRGRERGRS